MKTNTNQKFLKQLMIQIKNQPMKFSLKFKDIGLREIMTLTKMDFSKLIEKMILELKI